MQAWHIWVIIGILLIIVEIFTAGFLIINFGIGAIGAGIAAMLGLGIKTQIAVFAVVSLVLFIVSRKLASRYLSKDRPGSKTNVDALVGKIGVVTVMIRGTTTRGGVKVSGEDWSAIGELEEDIKVGDRVVVTGIDGNKLIVKKTE
ncbi:MAG: NfeD family protein [candidate division Zixibacteria bacterium]|nr:NfeD family protein [candidate division Zixibacteria bacterium]